MAPTSTKGIKRKGHGHQSLIMNNPFHNLQIGRRTGKPLNINARKDSDGFDNIDDYFPDDSEDEENIPPVAGLNSEAKGGSEEVCTQGTTSEPAQDVSTFLPSTGTVSPKNHEASASEVADNAETRQEEGNTPISAEEFPNDLGTAVKNDSVANPTPVIHGTRKRLQFQSDSTPPEPGVKSKVGSKIRSTKKNVSTRSSPDGESDDEIDVTGIDDDDNELVAASGTSIIVDGNSASYGDDAGNDDREDDAGDDDGEDDAGDDDGEDDAGDDDREDDAGNDEDENDNNNNAVPKSPEKANKEIGSPKKNSQTAERNKKTKITKNNKDKGQLVKSLSVSVVDIMNLTDNSNTFLTIGNATQHSSQAGEEIPPSPASSSLGSFVMDESVMMAETRHKAMSPEFGQTLKIDSSQSEETKNDKSKGRRTARKNKKQQIAKKAQPEREHNKKPSKEAHSEDHIGGKTNSRRKKQLTSQAEENENLSKNSAAVTISRKTRQIARVNETDEEGEQERVDTETAAVTRTTRQATRKTQQPLQQKEIQEKSKTDTTATIPRRKTRQTTRQMRSSEDESGTNVKQGGATTRSNRNTKSTKNLDDVVEEEPKKASKPAKSSLSEDEAVENRSDDIRSKRNTRQAKKTSEVPSPCLDDETDAALNSPSIKEQGGLQPDNEDRTESKRKTRQTRSNARQKTQEKDMVENEEEVPEETEPQVRQQTRKSMNKEDDINGVTIEQQDSIEVVKGREKTNPETKEKSETEDAHASTSSSSQNEGRGKNVKNKRRRKRTAVRYRPASERNRKRKQSSEKTLSKEINSGHSVSTEKDTGKAVSEDELLEIEYISDKAADQSYEEHLSMKANDTGRKRSLSIKTNAETSCVKSRKVISDIANSYIEKNNQSKTSRKKQATVELQEESVDPNSSLSMGKTTAVHLVPSESVMDCLPEDSQDLEPEVNGDDLPGNTRNSPSHPRGNDTPSTGILAPAAVKKSILKSGKTRTGKIGSGKSAATRKRKVSIAGKSQLQSCTRDSDADDEAQVNDEPVNKRRSSVSFAPKSTVFTSPLDGTQTPPAQRVKHAGEKLSFVSVNTSCPSEDDAYISGVSHTGYESSSSSSNASGSSHSSLDIALDSSNEITIKERATNSVSANRSSTSTSGLRRSRRTRVSPLKFWKNERIEYDTKRKSGFTFKGIIRNPTPKVQKRKRTKTTARKEKRIEDSGDDMYGAEDLPEGLTEEFNPTANVINPGTREEVALELFHVPEMLNFLNVSRQPASESDPLIIDKYMQHNQFSVGQFVLRAGADKGKQHVRRDTMIFYVLKGKVLVTVHETTSILGTGSTFFVPHGNTYQVKNLKNSDTTVLFIQVKGYADDLAQNGLAS